MRRRRSQEEESRLTLPGHVNVTTPTLHSSPAVGATRRSECLVLLRSLVAEDLLQQQRADEIADGQAIRSAGFVEIIGGEPAAGAGHIVDDHGRVAGYMLRHVARDGAGVLIEAAAG